MPAAKRRIVLCEDSRTYATALTRALEHDGSLSVVGVFPTAERALAELPRLKPDLVTMDLELPGMSGLDAVEQIMASTPTPVIVLSDYSDPESATSGAALAAGRSTKRVRGTDHGLWASLVNSAPGKAS